MNDTLKTVFQILAALVLGVVIWKVLQIILIGVMLAFQLAFVVGICLIVFWVLKLVQSTNR